MLLNPIKNMFFLKKNSLSLQFLDLLVVQGFISSVVEINSGKLLKISLKFDTQGTPTIQDMKLLSTPNNSYFLSYSQLAKIQPGVGCLILSTNQGLFTAQDCLKFRVGGHVLCFIS